MPLFYFAVPYKWGSRQLRTQGTWDSGPNYLLFHSFILQYRASEVAANYARKGREILAKVVLYKQGNEKPPLA